MNKLDIERITNHRLWKCMCDKGIKDFYPRGKILEIVDIHFGKRNNFSQKTRRLMNEGLMKMVWN